MKEITMDDILTDYGEMVLTCALISMFENGKQSFYRTTLREQIINLNEMYDKQEKEGKIPIITREFALQVLNCEYKLLDFDDLELLTYFSKIKKGGG